MPRHLGDQQRIGNHHPLAVEATRALDIVGRNGVHHRVAGLQVKGSDGIGDPYFVRGHYVVRTVNRFGRTVFVEVNPYTGAFLGEFRI